uniref:ATP synthase F0 subunit 8 n=1 Tax=Themus luteipes TaxID=3112899 RepID=UPI003003A385|nr:ATP synthase F0 subunit 8 [Themus luteipes]
MPQMAPLSWLNLFIFFIAVFLIFNSLNYFFFNKPCISHNKTIMKKNNYNWKW